MEEFQYKKFQNEATSCPIREKNPSIEYRDLVNDFGKRLAMPVEVPEDPVNSPKHYVRGGIEVIEVLEKKMAPEAFKGFLMGNVLKYVLRHEYKNGTEDLKKARFYLERMIALDGSRSTTDTK